MASALVNRLRLPTQLRDKLIERRTLRRVELAVAMSGLAVALPCLAAGRLLWLAWPALSLKTPALSVAQ